MLFYRLGIIIAALWNPKARNWVTGRKNIFENLGEQLHNNKGAGKKIIWFHCASLGEFEQGRPVIEKIKHHQPDSKILLTFFSPSGYEVQKNYAVADWVYYLPIDSATNARRFLDIVNPSLVIFVKYEFWYYYLYEIKKRNIPSLLISAIFLKKHPFFHWYGSLHKKMLQNFQHVFVQNNASKNLLSGIGFINKVTVSGDTRFDRVIEIAENFEPIPTIEVFIGDCSKIIVAGSTWPEDEEEMNHYANTHTDVKFIIAPHEIDEEHLSEIEKLFKYSIRYSRLQVTNHTMIETEHKKQENHNVLIIDNIGMLSKLYKYASIAFVGGGFETEGVHNVLEAAVYGKPVVYGPVFANYAEAVELEDCGGGIVVNSALEFEEKINTLFSDETLYKQCCEASLKYVYANKGATEKIMNYIYKNRLLTKS